MKIHFTDTIHEESVDVPRRIDNEIGGEHASGEERNTGGFLRRLDRRPEVPGGYGRLRDVRRVPPAAAEGQHALQAGLRGGWISQKPGPFRAQRDRTFSSKLYKGSSPAA